MGIPFKLLCPLPRGDENDELADVRSELGIVPEILPHLLQPAHEIGAAKQWHEWPHESSPWTRNDFLHGLLLDVRQLVRRNQRHSILRRFSRCRSGRQAKPQE